MESFSWFDSLRALTAPCLDCLYSSKNERNDLEDLLADSGSASATTGDAETLSLHSNPSSPRRKRARFTKHIRIFGWDLFGRRQPIRLPDDDEEDEEENGGEGYGDGDGDGEGQEQVEQRRKKKRRGRRGGRRRSPPVTISSSTLDSDAAPLDSAAIVSHATNYAEEEAKRAEEHRERRRQRKEMKRAAALALEQAATLTDGDEFEGFQGSGSQHMGSPPLLGSDDGTRTGTAQDLRYTPNEDDDDDDEGDFGGGAYTRRTSGSSDSGRGSDSRSRTSATTSVSGQQQTAYPHPHSGHSIQPYNHHYISQQPPVHTAAMTDARLLPVRRTKNKSSRSSGSTSKSSSSSASSTKQSRSSPSAPLSPSLASPVSSAAPLPTTTTITPSTAPPRTTPPETLESRGPRLQTAGIERPSSSGFPSPGIGGPRNGKRDMGAFLANRGDA